MSPNEVIGQLATKLRCAFSASETSESFQKPGRKVESAFPPLPGRPAMSIALESEVQLQKLRERLRLMGSP
jgi:hypothetical protein